MRPALVTVWIGLVGLVGLVGCNRGGDGETVPETPPPDTRPGVSGERVYGPAFQLANGTSRAGTGFFLAAPSGRAVALTASHVLDKPEWSGVRGVTFAALDGTGSVPLGAKPDYLGRSFDELSPIESGSFPVFNTSEDFAVWAVPGDGPKPNVLELAAAEPKVNEWVWAAGTEGGRGYALYRAKVTKVKGGTVMMKQHDKFAPRGFSGGPILSADGKVVGTMLAADANSGQMAGATAGTIRKRISGF